VPSAASEFWSWHSVDLTVQKTSHLEWILHSRFRTREGELQQGRSGTLLRMTPRSRVALIAGYYYGREEGTRDEWRDSHRMFGGAEGSLYRRGPEALNSRLVVERFSPAGQADFWRFRQRIQLGTQRRWGPVGSVEWFFDTKGYLATRYTGGLQWRPSGWTSVQVGYFFDSRTAALGPSRHFVTTSVSFDIGRRQKEQAAREARETPERWKQQQRLTR
jgi:hypothetical protein